MGVDLATLITQQTEADIYASAISIATNLGLPVTAWQPGDPTRALFWLEATTLSALESMVANSIMSGFLDYAGGDWLTVVAKQVFGVDRPTATYASTTVTLTNTGGGLYVIAAGDLTLKCSATGMTYHNTTGGTLASGPGTTLDVTVEADEAGSASSATAGEIDTLVTTLLGVTVTNATAATGIDAQDDATLRQQCRDKLGSLSANGPKDAYSYVARNSTLTGVTSVTRVRVFPDSTTGQVTVYLAGTSGAIPSGDVTAVSSAIATWCTPLCITPNVLNATNVTVNVTYQIWLYSTVNKTTAQVESDIATALGDMFAARPIGGDIIPPATSGSLYVSMIESTIRALYPNDCFRVVVSLPAGDVALTNAQVAVLGTITPTVTLIAGP